MHAVVEALLSRDESIGIEGWGSFWDALEAGRLRRGEAVALVASLSTHAPDPESVGALVASLDARREHPAPQDAVNIVGAGGGVRTFNVSTAAALVAATLGVRVVKSGSRAYSSRHGSIDMLELLGVPTVESYEAMHAQLDAAGIAFTGHFVYPPELTLLARSVAPLQMRRLGGFFNRIGPFLGAVPVAAQVTGIADHRALPLLSHLASHHARRSVWLCFNREGVDELVSFAENVISRHDGRRQRERRAAPRSGEDRRLRPGVRRGDVRLPPVGEGSLADLEPADDAVRQFGDVLAGRGPRGAIDSVCLNAAALVVAAGLTDDWDEAGREALLVIERGHARGLLDRLREAQ